MATQVTKVPASSRTHSKTYAALRVCALTLAHRFFAAFTIATLPAAYKTRFLTPDIS